MSSPTPPTGTVPRPDLAAEPSPSSRRLGSRFRRGLAWIVDLFLIQIPSFAVGLGVFLFARHGSSFWEMLIRLNHWESLVSFLVGALYFGLLNSRVGGGQTLGKRWMRLQTVGASGNTVTIARSLLRYAAWAIPYTVAWKKIPGPINTEVELPLDVLGAFLTILGVGTIYFVLANRHTQQGLHDLAVGTFVIDANSSGPVRFSPVWRRHWWIFGTCGAVLLAGISWFSHRDPYRQFLAAEREIEKINGIDSADISRSTHSEGGISLVVLEITAATSYPVSESEYLANQIAAVILKRDPGVMSCNRLKVTIKRGFEIGGFYMSTSVDFEGTPAEWKQKLRGQDASSGQISQRTP